MDAYRNERDALGEKLIPAEALFGIATERARAVFDLGGRPVHPGLVHAYGAVKLACARTNRELGALDEPQYRVLEAACIEMMRGELDVHVAIDALQGGAGTSTNLCVNEVLANRALVLAGRNPGDYGWLDPLEDVNRHQSTNDTFPTALRVAAILAVRHLEREVCGLVESLQRKERAFAGVVKLARTQLQDAVPITLGRTFGAYADAFARDRWRIAKCEERLRVVNLGGTAVGTGIGAPRGYIFRVVEQLRQVTGLGLARAENLLDATQNLDPFVEASGMVRALASTLIKVANDLRLMGSGPDAGFGEIALPVVQVGSSIMPGKVNPVVPEAVLQAALQAAGCDQVLFSACSMGNLELNHLLPLVADNLLNPLDLMARSCRLLARRCVDGITARTEHCRGQVETAVATATALVGRIGYRAAHEAAVTAQSSGRPLKAVVVEARLLAETEFDALIQAEATTRLGTPTKGPDMPKEAPPPTTCAVP